MTEFRPLFRNPHILTILANYWPRKYDFRPFPMTSRLVETEPGVQVLVQTQHPTGESKGELVLVHGLEGGGDSGYMVSLSHRALIAGFTVHRFHMRTCGGTEQLCSTLYHAGQTSDLISFLRQNDSSYPLFLVGFSLGGNVVLKATAESGGAFIAGVCTVAAAIDLAAGALRLNAIENRLYENRFVTRMKERLIRTGRYTAKDFAGCRSIYDIDNRITAPSFGFGAAERYYETQSSLRFVSQIHVPVLMIIAQDDPLVPYSSYMDPALRANGCIRIVAPRHGGHLGFVSRGKPRFWTDEVILEWIGERLSAAPC